MSYTLSEIWIYPIKSLGGVRLQEGRVEARGLQWDRRWMIVDENGLFLSQRKFAAMALFTVALLADSLAVFHKDDPNDVLKIPFDSRLDEEVNVKVWEDEVLARAVGDEADNWFSRKLGRTVRLVFMGPESARPVDPRYAGEGEEVSFADGYPFLLIGAASLHELNGRLKEEVEMKRFRPNFIVSGSDSFEEDVWKGIRIGDIEFRGVKRCARCVMVTINPETGEKGTEPLRTLATYRKEENKIFFGQNLLAKTLGTVKEGDRVSILID